MKSFILPNDIKSGNVINKDMGKGHFTTVVNAVFIINDAIISDIIWIWENNGASGGIVRVTFFSNI